MKIGIDLGGSHVAVGLISEKMEIVDKVEENLTKEEKENLAEALVKNIEKKVGQILENNQINLSKVEQIGIACPRNNKKWQYLQSRKPRVKKLSITRGASKNISKCANKN